MDAAEDVAEAEALLAEGDTERAREAAEALAVNPGDDATRYDYLRALLGAGLIDEARRAYDPVASRCCSTRAWRLPGTGSPPASAPAGAPEALGAALAANKRDFDARFELAQLHFAGKRFTGRWTNCSRS